MSEKIPLSCWKCLSVSVRKAGLAAAFLDPRELRQRFELQRTGAIESHISASANPAQLTAGLWRKAQEVGVSVVKDIELTDMRSLEGSNVVATSKGGIIQATHVVFCTGYEFLDAVANQGHRIVSNWALATRPHHPRPKWLTDYVVWEASDPYLYFRSTPDGRIIVGGEDEDSAEPDYQWAAAFGTTADGLPMIGAVPGFNKVYAAMGYGGNGITFSQIAAEILSAEILGHQDPDRELFAFR